MAAGLGEGVGGHKPRNVGGLQELRMAVAHTHEKTGAQSHDHKERSSANTWNEQDSP